MPAACAAADPIGESEANGIVRLNVLRLLGVGWREESYGTGRR